DVPIVPVATNLNCFWQQEEIEKTPGTAIIEFLKPIPVGLPKEEAIARLTQVVETRSAELIAEALDSPVEPTKLLPDPQKGTIGKPEPEKQLT
ncbi:MAG: 1-acyl-sn-glycerol-3-phosphate acyltransferase, partial [Pseudomonadota bacterium]